MPSHAIVIGSGVSGMSAAIALCKQGWRVLVLEQAARPGGLMASYRRGQCALPTGIHTIGAMGEGQATRRYLEYLGVWSGIHAVPMNVDGYAEFRFPDMSFLMPANYQAFRERLLERFGRQRLAIDQYLQDMKRTALGFPLYSFSTQPYAGGEETRTALQSYLDKLTDDEGLKRVIGAPNLLYGVEPKNCPLFVHFLVVDSYLRSAWRIDEHKAPLAEAFVDALLRAGGRIRCQTRASHFKCSGEQLQSVVVSDGEAIPADIVVYTGHPKRLPALCPVICFQSRCWRAIFSPGFWTRGSRTLALSSASLPSHERVRQMPAKRARTWCTTSAGVRKSLSSRPFGRITLSDITAGRSPDLHRLLHSGPFPPLPSVRN